jgi:hypothetical protein
MQVAQQFLAALARDWDGPLGALKDQLDRDARGPATAQLPETPGQLPETPAQLPETPAQLPETPGQLPETPAHQG